MARRLRLQFPGAIYHVFNRGRDGRRVFGTAPRARAFLDGLAAAAGPRGWRVHAYTLLPEGFHLVIETPQANLAEGMRSLLGAYGTRLTRRGDAHGAQFHGRYRSILLEPGETTRRTADFVHALPALRGLVTPDQLPQFRWSSLRLAARGERPDWLVGDPSGLAVPAAQAAAIQSERETHHFGCGWIAGSADWSAERRADYERLADDPQATRRASPAERAAGWSRRLDELLAGAERTRAEAQADRKSAPWKIALAATLRTETDVSLAWLARELAMGAPGAVSRYVAEWRAGLRRPAGGTPV